MTSVTDQRVHGAPAPSRPAGLDTLHGVLETVQRDPAVCRQLRGAPSLNEALRWLLDLRPELELLPLEELAQALCGLPGHLRAG